MCRTRCDALILTDTHGIRHVRLNNSTYSLWQAAQKKLHSATEAFEENGYNTEVVTRLEKTLLEIVRMLWRTTVAFVIKELEGLGSLPQRLFWCIEGASDLPIHAAGLYRDNIANLPDLVASSYTPTLSALLRARETIRQTDGHRILAIAQATTAGLDDLPGAEAELDVVRTYAKVPVKYLVNSEATPYTVLRELRSHSWAHFCCHGTVDPRQPLLSKFHLSEGGLTIPLNIESIMRASLPAADFAFLSACHTAKGSDAHSESMSLAAATQVAGFRSIVATMYAVSDDDGPVVAKEVYKFLFRDTEQGPTSKDAAVALNLATRRLRETGAELFRWVSRFLSKNMNND